MSGDAGWLRQLHSYGLLRGSFRPKAEIATLRTYMRQRERLTEYAAALIQHMQKALMEMNLQLHHVVSDTVGWAASDRLKRDLSVEALRSALPARNSCSSTPGFSTKSTRSVCPSCSCLNLRRAAVLANWLVPYVDSLAAIPSFQGLVLYRLIRASLQF